MLVSRIYFKNFNAPTSWLIRVSFAHWTKPGHLSPFRVPPISAFRHPLSQLDFVSQPKPGNVRFSANPNITLRI